MQLISKATLELLTTVTVGLSNRAVALEVGTLKVLHCAVELLFEYLQCTATATAQLLQLRPKRLFVSQIIF